MDLNLVLLILGFFGLSWGFVRLCAALEPPAASARQQGEKR